MNHVSAHLDVHVEIRWIDTEKLEQHPEEVEADMQGIDAVIIPGGFGTRGIEGKIVLIQYVREHKSPFLGICYGMQLAVVEFARHVCGFAEANSTEFDENTPDAMPVTLEGSETAARRVHVAKAS